MEKVAVRRRKLGINKKKKLQISFGISSFCKFLYISISHVNILGSWKGRRDGWICFGVLEVVEKLPKKIMLPQEGRNGSEGGSVLCA